MKLLVSKNWQNVFCIQISGVWGVSFWSIMKGLQPSAPFRVLSMDAHMSTKSLWLMHTCSRMALWMLWAPQTPQFLARLAWQRCSSPKLHTWPQHLPVLDVAREPGTKLELATPLCKPWPWLEPTLTSQADLGICTLGCNVMNKSPKPRSAAYGKGWLQSSLGTHTRMNRAAKPSESWVKTPSYKSTLLGTPSWVRISATMKTPSPVRLKRIPDGTSRCCSLSPCWGCSRSRAILRAKQDMTLSEVHEILNNHVWERGTYT